MHKGERPHEMTEPAIDLPTFEALQQTTGAEFVVELVDTFLAEAPLMLDELRQSITAQSADRFRRAAHSLKSNSNTFGALAMGRMAKALELGALPAADGASAQALDALSAEFARVTAALRYLCHG